MMDNIIFLNSISKWNQLKSFKPNIVSFTEKIMRNKLFCPFNRENYVIFVLLKSEISIKN